MSLKSLGAPSLFAAAGTLPFKEDIDRVAQHLDACTIGAAHLHHRWPPKRHFFAGAAMAAVNRRIGIRRSVSLDLARLVNARPSRINEIEISFEMPGNSIGSWQIAFVNGIHIANFQYPRLGRLKLVTQPRNRNNNDAVCHRRDLDISLTTADGLDNDTVEVQRRDDCDHI